MLGLLGLLSFEDIAGSLRYYVLTSVIVRTEARCRQISSRVLFRGSPDFMRYCTSLNLHHGRSAERLGSRDGRHYTAALVSTE